LVLSRLSFFLMNSSISPAIPRIFRHCSLYSVTLLADLQAQPAHALVLQLLVLCPKALKLCSQIFVRHKFSFLREYGKG
jgi:hypothetical protein